MTRALLSDECKCCGEYTPTIEMFEEHCNSCVNVLDCATCGVEFKETLGSNGTMCPTCDFKQAEDYENWKQEK